VVGLVHGRGDVRRTRIERRGIDRVDLTPLRQNVFGRRDVGPGLAAIAGQVDEPVIRPNPDQALRDRRLVDGEYRVVILDAGVVLGDGTAGRTLLRLVVARQIARDGVPALPLVGALEQDVGAGINHRGVVR